MASLVAARAQGLLVNNWIKRHYKPYEPVERIIQIDLTEQKKHYYGRMIRLLPILRPIKLGLTEEQPQNIRQKLHLRFLTEI